MWPNYRLNRVVRRGKRGCVCKCDVEIVDEAWRPCTRTVAAAQCHLWEQKIAFVGLFDATRSGPAPVNIPIAKNNYVGQPYVYGVQQQRLPGLASAVSKKSVDKAHKGGSVNQTNDRCKEQSRGPYPSALPRNASPVSFLCCVSRAGLGRSSRHDKGIISAISTRGASHLGPRRVYLPSEAASLLSMQQRRASQKSHACVNCS